jgi:hypothetical protein
LKLRSHRITALFAKGILADFWPWGTLSYGDMSGGFAPLKDIAKTMVYRLAKYRNSINYVIPGRVIDRAPSAELAEETKHKAEGVLKIFPKDKQRKTYG